MIEVNGKPFLLYILDYIQRFGFKEIILLSSHGSNIFKIILKILNIKIVILLFLKKKFLLELAGTHKFYMSNLDDAFLSKWGFDFRRWLSIIQDFNETCDC